MHVFTIYDLALDQADHLGDEITWSELAPVSVTLVENDEREGDWRVEAHFAERPSDQDLATVAGDRRWDLVPLVQRDWVRESLKGLKPVRAGRFYLHGAHDRDSVPLTSFAIEIEAGLAFGTGHHGTTRGCLIALTDILKRGVPWPVLDVGCGTGVLAIAYALAARRSVIASDIDPVAVDQTRTNARKNKTGPQVRARLASGIDHPLIRQSAPYQLIMANILARPLEVLAPALSTLLDPRGSIILSGLTTGQERRVSAAYRLQGLVPVRRIRLDGWSTLVLQSQTTA